jgi:flagellin
MASIINTNITSLIAQNNLSMTQATLQTTIERLSSGLRVNTAADDASGYAIANRMDAQVRGMAVATRNANDAISFSQTASGALSQISNNLQRMRELAVQAANGSNSSADTTLLNQEFSQLQIEVSRIQSSTQFNNVNVFTSNDIVFQVGANTSSGDRVNMQGSPLATTASLGTQTVTDRTSATAGTDVAAAIAAASASIGSSATVQQIYNSAIDAINSSQKLSFAAKTDALNTLSVLNKAYTSGAVTVGAGATQSNATNFITDINQFLGPTATSGVKTLTVQLTTPNPASPAPAQLVVDNAANGTTGGTSGVSEAVSSALLTLNNNVGTNGVIALGSTTTAGSILYTGNTAATGQTLAQTAISSIDAALTEVNTASAMQGALQNRFTAVISNLTSFSQSQTAAKSRIVDADFAAETAKLSKNQILQQAGTAMLAQANQLPSGILSLLKNG